MFVCRGSMNFMRLVLKSITCKIRYGRVIRLCIILCVFIGLRDKITSRIKHMLMKICFKATVEATHYNYNNKFVSDALHNSYSPLIKGESRCSTKNLSICFILYSVCFTVIATGPAKCTSNCRGHGTLKTIVGHHG